MHALLFVAIGYVCVNLFCALLLHLHGLRSARLPPRFLDVVMHFALFSVLAVPLLIAVSAEAFFGAGKGMGNSGYEAVAETH